MSVIQEIEKLYKSGGYAAIHEKYALYRMPKGINKTFTKKQKEIWKRYLNWRWKKNHPDFIKIENLHWYKYYRKVKPFVCICKKCGEKFNAPKKYYKTCPECLTAPSLRDVERRQILERKIKRAAIREQVYNIYITGEITQEKLAEIYNTSQENISRWIRLHKKYLQNKKK